MSNSKPCILILGVSGMLGSEMFKLLNASDKLSVYGTLRSSDLVDGFDNVDKRKIVTGLDVLNLDALDEAIVTIKPDIVINCVGLIKQLVNSNDPIEILPINAIFPHQLAKLCRQRKCRLIHISTDCVFSGNAGNYIESDISDARDLYGKSKYIGELQDDENAITLRTSIIGHELNSAASLIDWFLAQNGSVNGYTNAIFSGLPTVELARVVRDYVIPNKELSGLYHVSAKPISKFKLLELVSQVYRKKIHIKPDGLLCIDRSLDSSRFSAATGYVAAEWPELIRLMRSSKVMAGDK